MLKEDVLDKVVSELEELISRKGQINSKGQRENIIDSYNISSVGKNLLKHMADDNTSNLAKIKIARYFCTSLHDIYLLTGERRDIIITNLEKAIFNSVDLIGTTRIYYLNFKNEIVSFNVSKILRERSIKDTLSNVYYLQILKYMLRSYLTDENTNTNIFQELNQILDNPNTDDYTKMEIADIFLLNGQKQRGEHLLNELREIVARYERHNNQQHNIRTNGNKSVYNDSQNVHDHDINKSVLLACYTLITETKIDNLLIDDIRQQLLTATPQYNDAIITVLSRIQFDQSKFKYNDFTFGLFEIFCALYMYIQNHSNKDDLMLRLGEEMNEMEKYCSSGHMSRFINVIQGYTDDKRLQIRISDKQQINSIISHYLNKCCETTSDEIMDSMISDDKHLFYDFICSSMNNKINSIIREYGEVQSEILQAVKQYTHYNEWSIYDNVLKYTFDKLKPPEKPVYSSSRSACKI